MRKTLTLALLLITIAAFRHDERTAYRYTVIIQVMQNDLSDILATNEFISYNGYLIEFIKKEFSEEHQYLDPDKSTYRQWTEPSKVHFIDLASKTYFSVDTFSQDSKLIAHGPLREKNLGMNIGDALTTDDAKDYKLTDCKDTVFHGIEYIYYPYSIKDKQGQDSLFCKLLFLKEPDIKTMISLDAKSYLQNKYPMAGIICYTKDFKQGFAMYIKDKKAITENEALTIEKILEKHGKQN